MNIFFLSIDKKACAQYLVNRHIVKMLLEHTQILCSVHHVCGSIDPDFVIPYKLTHMNHPCSKWARESLANYNYLIELTLEMFAEYTFRYEKIHKSEQYVRSMKIHLPKLEDIGFTIPAQAMPDLYKSVDTEMTLESVVEAYRKYYFNDKKHLFAWKKRDIPEFITNMSI